MRTQTILTNLFNQNKCKIHKAHTNFLSLAIDAVLTGARLTCASLGRVLSTSTSTKHNIKRVNNMLGNPNLHMSRETISKTICHFFLNNREQPLVAIDWSSTNSTLKHHVLRATLILRNKGRGITLYEEVHPQKKLANAKVEEAFLYKLYDLFPRKTKPIIITDAGYTVRWFKVISKLNWDYVGRVRGFIHYKTCLNNSWNSLSGLFKKAMTKAKFINDFILSKKWEWPCTAILVKQQGKGTKNKTVTGKIARGTSGRKIAKRAREPWLLVTSLGNKTYTANQISNIYSRRMQIEEGFRDSKSNNYGMGLKAHRSKSSARIEILLLISMLANLIAYVIGLAGNKIGLQMKFQANTVKDHQVLSFVFLGFQIFKNKHKENLFEKMDFIEAWSSIQQSIDVIA